MLTKSEYSTSTSSLSSVFSGSLADLRKTLGQTNKVARQRVSQKPGSFKDRLKDRINKNKARMSQLKKVIEQSEEDILMLSDMKKILLAGEVAPLVTFVDQVKNTTDDAFLSMQRELASKAKDFEYVVYDRHVICLDQKLASEEDAYSKKCQHANDLFKKNILDKEREHYDQEVHHCERLLKEGEGLAKACKQELLQKEQELESVLTTIRQKEDVLASKMQQLDQLKRQLAKQESSSNTKMDGYILNSKLRITKQEIGRLRNEKLNLEATQLSYSRDIQKLEKAIKDMNKRQVKEQKEVKTLEKEVGSIAAKINEEIDRISVVKSSEEKLQTYLKKNRETRERLLREVNSKKKLIENERYRNLDTKTMRPVDWNKIEDQVSFCSSNKEASWIDEKSVDKSVEESKAEKTDEEKQMNFSFISFDPDCESAQSEAKLPSGLKSDKPQTYEELNNTPSSTVSKPLASSCQKRSKFELLRVDTDASEDFFSNITKIQEETDEESVNNLTPRLEEERELEANLLEEAHSEMMLRKSAEDAISKDIYASKTTLESEQSSFNKFELESDSTYDRRDREHPLNSSMTSAGGISTEDKYVSPTSTGKIVPRLNFAKMRKSLGNNSLNSSCISTTNASTVDSKFENRYSHSPGSSYFVKSLTQAFGSGARSGHIKNKLSHGKPVTNKKLTKGLKSVNGQYVKMVMSHTRNFSNDQTDSWKEKKVNTPASGFKGNHWDFKKKSCLKN